MERLKVTALNKICFELNDTYICTHILAEAVGVSVMVTACYAPNSTVVFQKTCLDGWLKM